MSEQEKFDELEKQLQDRLITEARKQGIDPEKIKGASVRVEQLGGNLNVKWGELEVTIPAPSQPVVDDFFKHHVVQYLGTFFHLLQWRDFVDSVIINGRPKIKREHRPGSEQLRVPLRVRPAANGQPRTIFAFHRPVSGIDSLER